MPLRALGTDLPHPLDMFVWSEHWINQAFYLSSHKIMSWGKCSGCNGWMPVDSVPASGFQPVWCGRIPVGRLAVGSRMLVRVQCSNDPGAQDRASESGAISLRGEQTLELSEVGKVAICVAIQVCAMAAYVNFDFGTGQACFHDGVVCKVNGSIISAIAGEGGC